VSAGRLLYVYAVVDKAPAELGLGLEGAPLRAIAAGRVAAVAGEHDQAPEADEEKLWQHEAVVERLMEDAVVLPLRFGATVVDEGALEVLLRAREAEFVELLDAVRGAVELSVRAELPVPEPAPVPDGEGAPPASGTEYMRERARLLRSRDRAREVLHESLSSPARRSVMLPAVVGREADFKGAYLVDAERVESFVELVGEVGEELGAELSCTGPWPPYTFVSGDGG
jgi:hypothetical protein